MRRRGWLPAAPGWMALVSCALTGAIVSMLSAGPAAQNGMPRNRGEAGMRQPREAVVSAQLLEGARAAHRTRPRFAPGHIIVKFEPSLSALAVGQLVEDARAREVVRPAHADFHYLRLDPGEDPVAAAARLAGRPGVMYAEPDPMVYPRYRPNDQYYRYQWNFPKIGMEAAWDLNKGGSTRTTVAVLDTGVAYLTQGAFAQAPDLAGTRFVSGYDFIWERDTPFDTDGHGTHVAGTIAQTTNNGTGAAGMAFNVNIMPVKVLASDWDLDHGAPNDSTMSILAQAIRLAADRGAKVINMSLGSEDPSSAVESAIRYAVGKGAFIATAAGNSGDEENLPEWPATYGRTIEGVMAVGAVGFNLQRAPYSTHRDYVEIAAPGGNLDEDLNNDTYGDGILQQTFDPSHAESGIFNRAESFAYMFYEGTSMSTAHVSGMAALLYDQGITSPGAIEAAIKLTASQKPAGGRNDDVGSGIIDVRAALRGLGLAR